MKERTRTWFKFESGSLLKLLLSGFIIFMMLLSGSVFANSNAADLNTTTTKAAKDKELADAIQETITVTGKVVDETEFGLPGVNIIQKGTMNGVITNFDGDYTIDVPANSVLAFSFIGFTPQEIEVNGQTTINVTMIEETVGLEEVVVTAMGVKSEKKKLNFAVQSMDSEEITRDKQTNFVDALQGRVAGVEISGAGGSPNASQQILIRGASSIDPGRNNEPIFILNGMHISGGASKAAEINPNDIESMTVLKGAAAAALYGSEAANGAIIITTKSGKEGAIQVNLSSSIQIDNATRVPELQDMYLRGGYGVYREESKGGWGPLKPEGTQTYDNVGNYLKTGLMQKYDLSVSGGSEKFKAYTSVSHTNHKGIVPEDYLKRYTILSKADYDITEDLTLSFMANLSKRESRSGGSMGSVYSWPIDDDMRNYKNEDGTIRWLYIDQNNRYNSPVNPYWYRYEDSGKSESYRSLVQGTLLWSPIENLDLTGRIGYDVTNSESLSSSAARWALEPGQAPTAEDYPHLGGMWFYDGRSEVLNYGGLAQYSYDLNEDFSMEFLAGIDFKRSIGRSANMGGRYFIIPDFESFSNLEDKPNEGITLRRRRQDIYGVFGEIKLDYKGLAHIGVTGRNDKSSTLAIDKNSYFYPSFSGGVIFTELLDLSDSNIINFGKLRGNWARVGKDATPYKLNDYFESNPGFPDGGYGKLNTSAGNPYLDPEMTSSWEIGVDMRLFNDKTRLDIAYYSTFIDDQIVTTRVSHMTGAVLQTVNEGDISNKGIEITWNQKIMEKDNFTWNMTTNFSHNEGTVGDLPGDVHEIKHVSGQVGKTLPTSYEFGPVFGISGSDYLRVKDDNSEHYNKIIVNADGTPKIDPESSILIGNREADFTIGIQNNWTLGNLSLSALINIRKGGDVVNGTLLSLMGSGMAKNLETYRNREIMVEGVVEQPDGSFIENNTPILFSPNIAFYTNYFSPVSTNFIEDGSFVRLANVTLSYDMRRLSEKIGIQGLKLSLTGTNLLLLTTYSGSDPVVNYTGSSGGAGTYGVDYLRVPNTRSVLFNISANF
ncbi:MAG: SusC/RagA family TonB-linked outer membrane protein [Bacteroidota bacterium]